MNQTVSHTFKILGTQMYPNARKTGLSRIGHVVPEVDGIIVLKRDSDRYILIFGSKVTEESTALITSELKKAIPDIVPESNELGQELYDTRRTEGTKAHLYFDRDTYV